MKKTILFLIIAGVLAAGCVSDDVPEENLLQEIDAKVTPTPAPIPVRTPVPPVETVPSPDPTPTPTPTPRNTTSTLCDHPPCGRGGGGGGSSGGGGSPPPIVCELPTWALMAVGLLFIASRRR